MVKTWEAVEAYIEQKVCSRALTELGLMGTKLVTPGRRGSPDRIFWLPGGKPLLIEFKRPGEQPDPFQAHIHAHLKLLGYIIEVHDDADTAFQSVAAHLARAMGAKAPPDPSSPVPVGARTGRASRRPRLG